MTARARIWMLTVLVSLYPSGQTFSDEVRHFTSPELRGTRKAVLEIRDHETERLTCLWGRSSHDLQITTGLTLFEIANNRLEKVWEDAETFFIAKDFDTGDLVVFQKN